MGSLPDHTGWEVLGGKSSAVSSPRSLRLLAGDSVRELTAQPARATRLMLDSDPAATNTRIDHFREVKTPALVPAGNGRASNTKQDGAVKGARAHCRKRARCGVLRLGSCSIHIFKGCGFKVSLRFLGHSLIGHPRSMTLGDRR